MIIPVIIFFILILCTTRFTKFNEEYINRETT